MDATRLPAAARRRRGACHRLRRSSTASPAVHAARPAGADRRPLRAGAARDADGRPAWRRRRPTCSTGAGGRVKVVAPEVLPTPPMADRALRELKQLGKVTSERIVRVVDQGRADDGRVYVATERVDGASTLEELVAREGPLPLERAKRHRAAGRRGADRGAEGRRHPPRRGAAQRARRRRATRSRSATSGWPRR